MTGMIPTGLLTHDDVTIFAGLVTAILVAVISVIGIQLKSKSDSRRDALVVKAAADQAVEQTAKLTDRVIEIRQQLPDNALFDLTREIRQLAASRADDLAALESHQTRQDVRLDGAETRLDRHGQIIEQNTALLKIVTPLQVAQIAGGAATQQQQVVQDGRLDDLEDTP